MNVIPLNCNHCAAPLEVPEGTRYLTCRFCNTKLEVQISGDAAFTRKVEEIEHQAHELRHEVDALKHHNELERLDRQWQMERESLLIRGNDGSVSEPSATWGVVTMIVGGAAGVIWFLFTASLTRDHPDPGLFHYFPFFGLLISVAGIGSGIWCINRAREFETRKREYLMRRSRLLHDSSENTQSR